MQHSFNLLYISVSYDCVAVRFQIMQYDRDELVRHLGPIIIRLEKVLHAQTLFCSLSSSKIIICLDSEHVDLEMILCKNYGYIICQGFCFPENYSPNYFFQGICSPLNDILPRLVFSPNHNFSSLVLSI